MEILIDKYIKYAYDNNVSDLHLKTGNKPYIRKNGALTPIDDRILVDQDVIEFNNKYSEEKIDPNNVLNSIDFSFNYEDVRFRVNTYHDINGYCASLRLLKLFSTDFAKLGVPNSLKKIATKPSGLILITGPTGSGKSTTLAALVSYLNEVTNKHIITIEDPVEYVFNTNNCLITQREIGADSKTFEQAIVDSLREDPDIIIVGEMRDRESIEAALVAAETGHLVLSTLHTRSAASTITRLIDMFPTDKQNQILNQLSTTLLAILSQTLIPAVDNSRMYLATEYLICTNAVASNIAQNKVQMITNMIELGQNEGMYLMSQSIVELYKKGFISKDVVMKYKNKN